MNPGNLCHRIFSSILPSAIVGSFLGLAANSAWAQSIVVTTPFSYCVNYQAYRGGTYQFTLISPWVLSIRNVKGGAANFFPVHPEAVVAQDLDHSRVASTGGLTFATYSGVRELQAVHEPGSGFTSELVLRRTHGSLMRINCFSEGSSTRDRDTTGR
jgi:hypothetical protein